MARSSMGYMVCFHAGVRLVALCCALVLPGCAPEEPAAPAERATTVAQSAERATATTTATQPPAPVIDVQISDGRVTPEPGRVEVARGDRVVFTVTSDVADDLHVHGYEVEGELPAGEKTTVELTADTPGLFEVETHDSGTLLFQLLVR